MQQHNPAFREFAPGVDPRLSPRRAERREPRYDFRVPLIVVAFGDGGPLFQEVALTRNLSQRGFCARLRTRPRSREAIAIGLAPLGDASALHQHVLCEILWIAEDESGWAIGASTLFDVDLLELAFGNSAPR